ncbi:MAG: c-type cytochrome [Burkholderiaceae bacterium]
MAATDNAKTNPVPTRRPGPSIAPPTVVGRALRVTALAAGLLAAAGAQAQATAGKPDPAKAQKIVDEVCTACHGADGNSSAPANPKLAAQHADYLRKQLHDFKAPEGKPATRPSPVMAGIVTVLTDADIANVSAYYSAQKLKPSTARNKDTVELGQRIYRGGIAAKGVPACSGCHSPNGAGMPAQYPHLAGQFADYTQDQLIQFRAGKRQNSPQMVEIAARLSDLEIQALSDYIAGLR